MGRTRGNTGRTQGNTGRAHPHTCERGDMGRCVCPRTHMTPCMYVHASHTCTDNYMSPHVCASAYTRITHACSNAMTWFLTHVKSHTHDRFHTCASTHACSHLTHPCSRKAFYSRTYVISTRVFPCCTRVLMRLSPLIHM